MSLVDCTRVFVKPDAWGGAGAFATVDIKEGELVEKGIVRVLTNCDGNENPCAAPTCAVYARRLPALRTVSHGGGLQIRLHLVGGKAKPHLGNRLRVLHVLQHVRPHTPLTALGGAQYTAHVVQLSPFCRRSCEEADSNTHMVRDFPNKSFVINATKDIKAGDELFHVYLPTTFTGASSLCRQL